MTIYPRVRASSWQFSLRSYGMSTRTKSCFRSFFTLTAMDLERLKQTRFDRF